ncbi:hypothetical protein PAHAL_4G286000 [Panicum hallii]|uniref:Uncharacterized protein n=1 Tax=Panicum hallii TaxID=206008 RepID=A0A2S3HKU2_9POAL|nr:hypothetical protein PAHAL_4G286000 [Panicum hallii]
MSSAWSSWRSWWQGEQGPPPWSPLSRFRPCSLLSLSLSITPESSSNQAAASASSPIALCFVNDGGAGISVRAGWRRRDEAGRIRRQRALLSARRLAAGSWPATLGYAARLRAASPWCRLSLGGGLDGELLRPASAPPFLLFRRRETAEGGREALVHAGPAPRLPIAGSSTSARNSGA